MEYAPYIENFNSILSKIKIFGKEGNEMSFQEALRNVFSYFNQCKLEDKFIYLIGNGGSNAIISHLSVDLIKACHLKAFPITDSSILTCYANDYGYANVFSQLLEKLMRQGDMLIAVSSSGESDNIVNAVSKFSVNNTNPIVTLTAFHKFNRVMKSGDVNFWLDTMDYGFAEIGHALILHYLTDIYRLR